MKKIFIFVLLILLLAAAAVNAENEKSLLDMIAEVTGEDTESGGDQITNGSDKPESLPDGGNITVMIYLCGSTLEEQTGSATRDITEMINSGFDPEKVNVVIMAGGSRKWANRVIPGRTTGIYYLTGDNLNILFNDGNAYNMGDPGTLSRFLTLATENFHTEHYALILWDHGGGSISGICQDENFEGDSLSMAELDEAFKDSPFAKQKLDWIGFDACLMSSAETAKVLAPYAEYMIASEESEPSDGWNYAFLKDLEKDKTAETTGKRIIESYNDAIKKKYGRDAEMFMSCTNLNKITDLVSSIDDFFTDIEITKENYAAMSRARRTIIGFGRDGDSLKDPDLVDLGHMVKTFSQFGDSKKADNLLNAINDTVPELIPEASDATGLSVYFPFNNKYAYSRFMKIHSSLDFSDPYEVFITSFGKHLLSSGASTWSVLSTIQDVANRAVHSRFIISLTDEQAASIGTASLVALQKAPDAETWQLVGIQEARIENDDSLAGEYRHTNLFFTDQNGDPLYPAAIVYEDLGDDLIRIPVVLVDDRNNETDAIMVCTGDPEKAITYLPAGEDGSADGSGIEFYLFDEAIDGYSPRLTADLSQFSGLKYMISEKEMTYEDNALLSFDQWKVVKTAAYDLPLDESWKLMFIDDKLDTESLYIAFQITDIYNNVFTSAPAKLTGSTNPDFAIGTVYEDQGLVKIENEKFIHQDKRLSVLLTNISDTEAFILADNFTVNDIPVDLEAEVYGTGPNWGLIPEENQPLSIVLPVDNGETVTKITYDLTFFGPDEEMLGIVSVTHAINN